MDRRWGVLVLALALAAGAAHAQSRGGRGGGGGRSSGGGGGGESSGGPPPPPATRPIAANRIDIVGVVQAILPAEDRITIAYEETQALNLPAGTRTFVVAKTSLLKDVTVGEKVKFRLDSQQVSALARFDPDAAADAPDDSAGPRRSQP